jgi:urate oxidase
VHDCIYNLMLTVCVRSEGILQDILDTMYESDIFERTRKDAPSRFWSTYERVAKQHDDEFIERHSGDLDVLLIFVRAPFLRRP